MSESLPGSLRREVKYKIFARDSGAFYSWLLRSPFKTAYKPRCNASLYFDTTDLQFAFSNISGEANRLKIRARWYSDVTEDPMSTFCEKDQKFTIEIKCKFNTASDKIILDEIIFDSRDSIDGRISQIKERINLLLRTKKVRHSLQLNDVLFVFYKRSYYEHVLSRNIRMTVDKEISCTRSVGSLRPMLISKDYEVVELKYAHENSEIIENLMKSFRPRIVRFSKYIACLSSYVRISY